MNYKLVDFRSLVTLWYNEFLPERIGNKSVFVEDAGILYLKPISLDNSIRQDTLGFFKQTALELSDSNVGLVVQEPKPVNNVRIQPILRHIEGMQGLSNERRDKVLHFANRRYVPVSSNIMVSQDKEMDDFLADVFVELAGEKHPTLRFYPIQSLGMQDFVESAQAFFPKKALIIQSVKKGRHIQVRSTNDMLEQLKFYAFNGVLGDSANMNYISRCKESIGKDIETLI